MVTAALAQRFWPGQSAVGRRIKSGDLTERQNPWWTIVGVLQDANLRGIPQNPTKDPDIFLPFNERSRGFAVLLQDDRRSGGADQARDRSDAPPRSGHRGVRARSRSASWSISSSRPAGS